MKVQVRRNGKPVLRLRVTRDGTIYGVTEEFPLADVGRTTLTRLSTVEWYEVDQCWKVFSRLSSTFIGGKFKTRRSALDYERRYMDRRLGRLRDYAGVR